MAKKQEIEKRQQADVVRTEGEQKEYFQPATDVRETSDALILQFDMPGVNSDNVELTVEKGTLTYRETRVGDYRRVFSLNDNVNTEDIKAEMKAGVLTVKIPKPEIAKPKRIAIQSG